MSWIFLTILSAVLASVASILQRVLMKASPDRTQLRLLDYWI